MKILHEEEEDRTRFGDLDPEDPDLQTVETFVEACMADNVTTFNWQHLSAISWNLRTSRAKVRAELEGFGLQIIERPSPRRVRTCKDNPNDRWYGPGSSPSHGGSGWEQIEGFAGPPG